MATPIQIVMDCADPRRMAAFWSAALHYRVQDPPPGYASWEAWLRDHGVPDSEGNSANAVVDPDGVRPRIYFQRVPEAKAVKNRVHLDLNIGGPRDSCTEAERRSRIDAEVERLVGLGARKLQAREVLGEYFVNLVDPEGNEFDVQ